MKVLIVLTSLFLALMGLVAAQSGNAYQADQQTVIQAVPQKPQELQQLVAPIALYPDALVAQILVASTYPAEVVEADRWLQQHSALNGEDLGKQVDQQQWDPSIKALTQFPTVLANLDKNITWTSGLGDAYTNQQQDVMDAVQAMRQKAQTAGNLNTTSQQTVSTQSSTIIIQPVDPDVIYVPEYDPWFVYGSPLVAYPGWYPYPDLYIGGPGIFFGSGFGLGYFGGFGWGWRHWDADWHGRRVLYEHNTYISHSPTFINRHNFDRGRVGVSRGSYTGGRTVLNHGGSLPGRGPSRGFNQAPNSSGARSTVFSGFDHGGVTRSYSAHGQSSLGGFHGAGVSGSRGGGFSGGGGHAGGRR